MKTRRVTSWLCTFVVVGLATTGLFAQEVEPIEIPIEPPVANGPTPPIAEDVAEEDEFQEREAAQPQPTTPEPATPEPAQPEPTTPQPAQPEPVDPQPTTPEPALPEPVQPQPVQPQPLPNEPEVVPPAQPQPPAGNQPDPAVEQLQSRIELLESQIKALQNQPATPTNIEQPLEAIEQSTQSLEQRLNAVERYLRDNGSSLSGGGARSDGDDAGGGITSGSSRNGVSSSNGVTSVRVAQGGCCAINGGYYRTFSGCYGTFGGCPQQVCYVSPRFGCGGACGISSGMGSSRASSEYVQPRPDSEPSPTVEELPPPELEATEALLPEARATQNAQPIAGRVSVAAGTVADLPEPIDIVGMTRRDSGELYTNGYNSFWNRQYSDAVRHFAAAAMLRPDDARFLYYRGLAELRLGHRDTAVASIRAAAQLEQAGSSDRSEVSLALERVQGRRRVWLESYRQEARVDVAGR